MIYIFLYYYVTLIKHIFNITIMSRNFYIWAFLFSILISSKSYTQDCDPRVKPINSPYGYKKRGNARCEGLYSRNVSGTSLDVISFTKGRLKYFLSNNEVLTISGSQANTELSFNVKGMNFGMTENYRLDMNLDKGEKKLVPLSEVIIPSRISYLNFGIFGYLASNGELIYLPLSVSSLMLKNRIVEDTKLFLTFLSNINIEKIFWRYGNVTNGFCNSFSSYTELAGNSFPRISPIVIELPRDLSNKNVCIELKYKVDEEWIVKSFKIRTY